MWYINMPVDKQRDFRRRRNTWKTVKNKYFIQNALCFANSQDKATNFATVISWIRCNAERAAGCVLILSMVSSPCFFGMTVVSPYIFCILLWSIADIDDEVQDYLWVCVLTSNKPACSGFVYAFAVIYMWPKGSRFKKQFSHRTITLGSEFELSYCFLFCIHPMKAWHMSVHTVARMCQVLSGLCTPGTRRILPNMFVWKASRPFCSAKVRCMFSSPYKHLNLE